MIYLMLMKCGLGNQMFSYAYARYLQQMNFKDTGIYEALAINPYQFTFGKPAKIVEERGLSLQHFVLGESVRFLNEAEQTVNREQYLHRANSSMGVANKLLRKLFNAQERSELDYGHRFRRGLYVSYRPHSAFKTILSEAEKKFVFGYYQNAEPLCSIEEVLKADFAITTPPRQETQRLLNEIERTNSVCLHIRRGDYLVPECRHLNICKKEYYQQGIDYIRESVENPTFYVFSNSHEDIQWIRENYKFENADIVYVDEQNPDYEELRLMKACKHFVISNSSFSWWAAFLSENKGKIVCMPQRWDLEYPDDANMGVPGWIKLPVDE